MQTLVDKLYKQHILTAEEFRLLLTHYRDHSCATFYFHARAPYQKHSLAIKFIYAD